jgi:hypothetical protein
VPAAGQYGVNRDLSTHELPVNAWTDVSNIRFVDGMAAQVLGYKELYPSASVIPYHLLPVDVLGIRTWIYAGAAKLYTVVNGAVHTNITRQSVGVDVDYSAVRNSWTSTVLGGIPILNSGLDAPQQWLLTGKATDLTNWPANNTAYSIRAYKNSLIALNITKAGTSYPYMVKWSHPAEAGTLPITWDAADATKDAGEFDLSEGYDTIVDGLSLRDAFIIYKQSSIWRMDYTGGIFVYRFQKIINDQGVLARNCVAEIKGQHFVFSNSDCITHDGQTATSVLDKQTRRDLFSQINPAKTDQCFVFVNRGYNEVFACFPTLTSDVCNKAMVWNYVDRTVSFRELPNINFAENGPVDDTANATWDSDTDTWDSDNTPWDSQSASLNRALSVMASENQKLYLLDSTTANDGVAISAYAERRGLSVGEPESMKLVRSIRPRIYGDNGYVNVQVGYGATPYSEPVYNPPVPFYVNSTVSIDSFVTGRYLAVKFSSGTAATWRLDSYDIDVQKAGSW